MAGRKVDLAALGERVTAKPPDPAAKEAVESKTPETLESTATPDRQETRRDPKGPAPGQWVRYDELERKETRLRPDQYGQLSDLSRNLNRIRAGKGERITENTLIRVGIDLLLTQQTELDGCSEAELRKSVGL